MSAAWAAVSLTAAAVVPIALLSVWSAVRFARRFPSFRCRVALPSRRRSERRRWSRRRAAWVGDVLLVRSRPVGSWPAPLATGVPRRATVRPLDARAVRGLGPRPVGLRLVGPDGLELEIAVAEECAARVVGPYLLAGMPHPPAPKQRDA